MKHIKLSGLLAAATLVLAAMPAQAQFDFFGQPRTLQLYAPTMVTSSTAVSNVVDIHMFKGIVKVDLLCLTNGNSGQTMTCTLSSSPDQTNCTALSGYALATSTTINYTNGYYGTTNLIGTNVYLLPGTSTTPTAATAGYATAYLLAAPFTNSSTITVTGNKFVSVGFNADDVGRYLHVQWIPGANVTNTVVGAVLTGRAGYVP